MLGSTEQRLGCGKHLFIPDIVAGEVVDAGEDFVAYRKKDGSEWLNDARGQREALSC
jgi:hypothetical protein